MSYEKGMERWAGKVAVVTGASSGIGAAISKEMVFYGMKVVGLARNAETLQEIAEGLQGLKGVFYPLVADVSNIEEVKTTFEKVKDIFGGIHVLVNNAGIIHHLPIAGDCDLEMVHNLFDTNVVGYIACANEAVKNMKNHKIKNGHIFFINSISGHEVFRTVGIFPYNATKYAVTVIAQGFRRELLKENNSIRVTSISPSMVKTKIFDKAEFPGSSFSDVHPKLKPENVADALMYSLSTPPEVEINDIILRAAGDKS